jgi:DNA polymerase-3 subunit delta'
VVFLIGQSRAESLLAGAIARDRVGHAYLFLGPTGAGKATAARLFAQALNCERQPAVAEGTRQSSGETGPPTPLAQGPIPSLRLAPCGACESCRRILAGTHPEVLEVRPESKTRQNISVDQAREIRMNAALRPKLGRRRIYLIPNAEAFNEESANALLKTLEEPSPGVTLVLCAPSPSQVLPTIRSRCQVVRFGLSGPAQIAAALAARGTEPELAEALACASGGRPGLAFSWAQDRQVLQRRNRILDLFGAALQARREAERDPAVCILSLRLAEQLRKQAVVEKGDEDQPARPAKVIHSEDLETGLTLLRDLMLLSRGAAPELVQNQDRLPALMEMARHTPPERVPADIDAVREAQQILDRNVAPQLVLERMFWTLIAPSA